MIQNQSCLDHLYFDSSGSFNCCSLKYTEVYTQHTAQCFSSSQHSVATAHFPSFCTVVYIYGGRVVKYVQTVLAKIVLDSECILDWNLRKRIMLFL